MMANKMKMFLGLVLAMVCLVSNVYAAPQVEVSIAAEKEIVVKENGKKVTKRIKAEGALPGDIVFYTLSFENKGDEPATDVALVDPVPENTAYIENTAFGPGSDITFSIDQGKNYKKPNLLTYTVNGKKRTAAAEQYTHIRWLVKTLGAGKSGVAGFQVVVK